VQALAEHLQAAADAEHAPAGIDAGGDRVREPRLAEPGEVGRDVLRAGQNDELGAVEGARTRDPFDPSHLLELAELVEVRGRRIADDGDGGAGAAACRRSVLVR
jgi:hypothetical protein